MTDKSFPSSSANSSLKLVCISGAASPTIPTRKYHLEDSLVLIYFIPLKRCPEDRDFHSTLDITCQIFNYQNTL